MRKTLLTALLALLAAAAPAAAAPRAEWVTLAREVAAPWPAIQNADGSLPDYMDCCVEPRNSYRGTRYGDAMMGYGLISVGVRENDQRLVDAGIRAISYATDPNRRHPGDGRSNPSVFEQWGVAAAYNVLRRQAGNQYVDPLFDGHRARWERWLKQQKTVRFGTGEKFSNHDLVEGVAVMEMLDSGLESNNRGTILGTGRSRARSQTLHVINRKVPRVVRRSGPAVVSDVPDQPAAYQALSLGLYAHLVQGMGSGVSGRARQVLRRAAEASWRMAAPDADQGIWGRSQELVWVYSGAAYGGAVAAGLSGTSSRDAARYRELAQRSLARLRSDYPVTDQGQMIVPALRAGPRRAVGGIDRYAGAPSMGGVALAFLNLALDEPAASLDGPTSRLAADGETRSFLGSGPGRVAVVRRGDIWYAVRAGRVRAGRVQSDVRYDTGLVGMKRREGDGWRDVLPHRPNTLSVRGNIRPNDSSGPNLMRGRRAFPTVTSLVPSGRGAVSARGGFYFDKLRRARVATFRYVATGCGVRLSFSARRGERFELSSYFDEQPRVSGRTVANDHQRLTASIPVSVRLERRNYTSAMKIGLVRARVRGTARRSGTVRFQYC